MHSARLTRIFLGPPPPPLLPPCPTPLRTRVKAPGAHREQDTHAGKPQGPDDFSCGWQFTPVSAYRCAPGPAHRKAAGMPTPWRGWQVTNVGHARDLDGAAGPTDLTEQQDGDRYDQGPSGAACCRWASSAGCAAHARRMPNANARPADHESCTHSCLRIHVPSSLAHLANNVSRREPIREPDRMPDRVQELVGPPRSGHGTRAESGEFAQSLFGLSLDVQ